MGRLVASVASSSVLIAWACTSTPAGDSQGATGTVDDATSGLTDGGSTTDGGPTGGGSADDTPVDTGTTMGTEDDTGTVVFDVPVPDAPGGTEGDVCKVSEDGAGVGTCEEKAPPDAFEPDVQWEWNGNGTAEVYVTPLVANFTDDNGDGEIDLCDIPDVVVVVTSGLLGSGHIVVLSGDDGAEHFEIPVDVNFTFTPAVGDIDNDGLPEIVTVTGSIGPGNVVAFEHDGTTKWTSPSPSGVVDFASPALADLEGDGDVEILVGGAVYDASGVQLFQTNADAGNAIGSMVTTADLDDDGVLEIVHGAVAYRSDGTLYYSAPIASGLPQIGNFDDDDDPEIIVMNPDGINLLDHTGTPVWTGQRPTGDPATVWTTWFKPATIHDFDGDGQAELATGSGNNYAVYEIDETGATILWQAPVLDASGSAGGTAFDFLGDGIAEAMYADETQLFVFDGTGTPLLTAPRQSATGLEYPVVADIDNDGSAEIVVVSNSQTGSDPSPAVQAIRDVEDRWIQARRIWNQHTYHVANVREDGTIPPVPAKSWLELNTFRTNAQIENGGVCQPEPAG